jgi:hypothetical protein
MSVSTWIQTGNRMRTHILVLDGIPTWKQRDSLHAKIRAPTTGVISLSITHHVGKRIGERRKRSPHSATCVSTRFHAQAPQRMETWGRERARWGRRHLRSSTAAGIYGWAPPLPANRPDVLRRVGANSAARRHWPSGRWDEVHRRPPSAAGAMSTSAEGGDLVGGGGPGDQHTGVGRYNGRRSKASCQFWGRAGEEMGKKAEDGRGRRRPVGRW